jgi:hypothetical protein
VKQTVRIIVDYRIPDTSPLAGGSQREGIHPHVPCQVRGGVRAGYPLTAPRQIKSALVGEGLVPSQSAGAHKGLPYRSSKL